MDERFNEKMYQANIKLVDENSMLKDYTKTLERRIDKALNYIEIIQYNETYGVKEKDYLELIDILKGDSYEQDNS